ncbi:hypothetical protein OSTOST_23517, partial [Ostertagia ostertagi]
MKKSEILKTCKMGPPTFADFVRITAQRSPIASSSNVSMEYDDLFEMYSDEDYNRNYTLNPITAISSTTKLESESSCSCANPLRRKDLNFDDPLVLAVPG